MELKLVRGCICDSLTVDDIEEIELTDNQRKEAITKISDWLTEHPSELNYVLQELIPCFGEYECDDIPCECCGDYVETFTWNI